VIGHCILKADASGATIFNGLGGTVTSLGYNLSSYDASAFLNATGDQNSTDPVLGPLQDNGGPTFTHKLLSGSPAIDAGDPSFTPPPNYDQRGPGFSRVVNGRIDIGAFELQSGPPPTPTPTSACTPPPTPPSPCNQPPLATDDFYGMNQGSALSVPIPGVLANDSDPDEDTLTVALVTGPAHAISFQLNPNGSFSYTPPAYFHGEDSFTYRANDGTASSGVATVHITVSQPGSAGFITGGGNFLRDGHKCTFGFVAKVQSNGVQGNLEFQDRDANKDIKSQVMQIVYAGSSIDGYFGGTCRVNGAAGYTFFVQIHDRGEPGRNDDLTIWIFDSLNNLVYTAGALLSGGNIVIHDFVVSPSPTPTPTATATPTPTATPSSRHWWCDNDGDGAYMDYGFSSTAPFPNCTDTDPSYIDYCDCDPYATSPCECP